MVFTHLNRRTVSASAVLTPPSAASVSRRTYRPCTRDDPWPQRGHVPSAARTLACMQRNPAHHTLDHLNDSPCQVRNKFLKTPRTRSTTGPFHVRTPPRRVTRSATEPVYLYLALYMDAYTDSGASGLVRPAARAGTAPAWQAPAAVGKEPVDRPGPLARLLRKPIRATVFVT